MGLPRYLLLLYPGVNAWARDKDRLTTRAGLVAIGEHVLAALLFDLASFDEDVFDLR